MAYLFYMDGMTLPVPPSSMTIQTPNRNETIDLIDGTQVNVLKEPGLKTIQFECEIPQLEYPYADYGSEGFKDALYYLDKFEKLKANKKPFQFIVMRFKGNGRVIRRAMGDVDVDSVTITDDGELFMTNIKVSLEDFNVSEDAENGFDLMVTINMKEYVDYGTQEFIVVTDPVATDDSTTTVTPVEPERPVDGPSQPTNDIFYTVQDGDSLWGICASQLGDGGKCWAVASNNGIADPDAIYPGQVLNLSGV